MAKSPIGKKESDTNKPQKNGLMQRGKNYAKGKINKAKEYGTQKGKEALGKGAEYAKGKGQEFLAKNPKVAESINKAKEAKENFENQMGGMKENLQSGPIKQRPGEKNYEFRKRQKEQDDNSPDNIKDRSLGNVAGQRLRTGINKRIEGNPAMKVALIRAEKIKKLAALKAQKFSNRIKALNARAKKIKEQLNIKKRLKDELKKRVAQYAIRFLWPAIAFIIAILIKLLIVAMAVVVVIYFLKTTCESNPLFDAACSYFIGM